MKEKIIRLLVKAWMGEGWELIEPGYHRHKNPVTKKTYQWSDIKQENIRDDARDMAIEIAKARGEQDAI
jgi:hypothetical protein